MTNKSVVQASWYPLRNVFHLHRHHQQMPSYLNHLNFSRLFPAHLLMRDFNLPHLFLSQCVCHSVSLIYPSTPDSTKLELLSIVFSRWKLLRAVEGPSWSYNWLSFVILPSVLDTFLETISQRYFPFPHHRHSSFASIALMNVFLSLSQTLLEDACALRAQSLPGMYLYWRARCPRPTFMSWWLRGWRRDDMKLHEGQCIAVSESLPIVPCMTIKYMYQDSYSML